MNISKNSVVTLNYTLTDDENEILDSMQWVAGLSADQMKNGQVIFVDIKKVIPPTQKMLEEAKGIITADYQSYLEKEWIGTLRQKYPVVIKQEVLDSISN